MQGDMYGDVDGDNTENITFSDDALELYTDELDQVCREFDIQHKKNDTNRTLTANIATFDLPEVLVHANHDSTGNSTSLNHDLGRVSAPANRVDSPIPTHGSPGLGPHDTNEDESIDFSFDEDLDLPM